MSTIKTKNIFFWAFLISTLFTLPISLVNATESSITVTQALYATKVATPKGSSKTCNAPGIPQDKTALVAAACNGNTSVCSYMVPWPSSQFPDPAEGCYKDFQVKYTCSHDTNSTRVVEIGGEITEAANRTIYLGCGDGGEGILIKDASYGQNCNDALLGNRTSQVMTQCQGRESCNYTVSTAKNGDPAFGCPKTFVVNYSCGSDPNTPKQFTIAKEADNQTANLSCTPTVPAALNVTSVKMSYNTTWSKTNPKIFVDGSQFVITNNTGNITSAGWKSVDVYAFNGELGNTMQKIGEIAVNLPALDNGKSYTYNPTPYQANDFSKMVTSTNPTPAGDYYIFIKVRGQDDKTGGYSTNSFRLPPVGM